MLGFLSDFISLDFLFDYISLDFLPELVINALPEFMPGFLADFVYLILTALVDIYGVIITVILEIPNLLICFSPILLHWIPAFILAKKRFSWAFFWVGFGMNTVYMAWRTMLSFAAVSDVSVRIILYWIFFYALVMFLGGSIAHRSEKHYAKLLTDAPYNK